MGKVKVPTKPQIHQSGLAMLSRCGEQYRRVYIEGHKAPPAVQLLVGRATHEIAAKNLNHKIKTKGRLLRTKAVMEYARDEFLKEWASNPIILDDTEKQIGLRKIKGLAIDQTVKLAELHSKKLAPILNPIKDGVEWAWVVEVPGYPFDLAGQIDVIEQDRIRDLKTQNRVPSFHSAVATEQLSLYGLARKVITNKAPKKYFLDFLVKESKTKPARLYQIETRRTREDFLVFQNRFERAIKVIESGAFQPANRSDWWCSEKYCGFAADGSCQFFNGRASTLKLTKRKEVNPDDNTNTSPKKRSSKRPNGSSSKRGVRLKKSGKNSRASKSSRSRRSKSRD